MKYEIKRIKEIIEYKDNIDNIQFKTNIEWLIEKYNDYFVSSREYEEKIGKYNKLLNQYYNIADEKAALKQEVILLKKRIKAINELHKDSCKKKESML